MKTFKRLVWILWVVGGLIGSGLGLLFFIPFWIITGKVYWFWLVKKMDNVKWFDEIFNNPQTSER